MKNKKHSKILAILIVVMLSLTLSSCWDYRGMDQVDIVTGVAIDYNQNPEEKGKYHLTFEMIDTVMTSPGGTLVVKYIHAYGDTVFDTVRNAKKRLIKNIYFGNMQSVIISQDIAKTEGVGWIIDLMLRNSESRETMSVVISYEEDAETIFKTIATDTPVISAELKKTVDEDNSVTCATVDMPLFEAYDALHARGKTLLLPVFRTVENEKRKGSEAGSDAEGGGESGEESGGGESGGSGEQSKNVTELYGAAVFDGDILLDFIEPLDMKDFLFLTCKVEGGALVYPVTESKAITFTMRNTDIKRKAKMENDKLKVDLSVKLELNLVELATGLEINQSEQKAELEKEISQWLSARLTDYFYKMNQKFPVDLFSLGNMIYKNSRKKWQTYEANWKETVQNAEIKVNCDIIIPFSGVLDE